MTVARGARIAKALSLMVSAAGLLVMIGWIGGIPILASVSPDWVTMKFSTALAFAVSGVSLYALARAREGALDVAQVVLSLTSLILVLLMGVLFFAALLRIDTGAENLIVKEPPATVKTVFPGRPSLPTMVSFLLVAAAGIAMLVRPARAGPLLKGLGIAVGAIGAVGALGYLVGAPTLYYFWEDVNSAMACATAVLFILLGTGLLCLSD